MANQLPTQTYQTIDDVKTGADYLRNKLKVKSMEAKDRFSRNYPHVEKKLKEKGINLGKIREHSSKIISAGLLTGSLLLSPPSSHTLPTPKEVVQKADKPDFAGKPVSTQEEFIDELGEALPAKTRPLSREEEKKLEPVLESATGVKARATLEGEHLNTTYGLIGAEQHLRRYPGDTLQNHASGSHTVLKEGIAPGLGAWGYFAPSRDRLSSDLVETEKWYAVVQTLYLPDWNTRQPYLRDWYKYRKVLIVNTTNGNAVVAAIADSGPAAWTGKHFGGSPEVMEHLGGPRYKKGPVLLFFVDDPDNKVSLGPVDYNKLSIPKEALVRI